MNGCGCNDGKGNGADVVQDGSLPEAAMIDSGGMSEREWLPWPDAGPDAEVDGGPNPNVIVFPEEGDHDVVGFTNQGTIIAFSIHHADDPVHKTDVYYYDILEQKEYRLMKPYSQAPVSVFNQNLVYSDYTFAETDVDPQVELFVYNIDTDTHTRITDTPWSEIRPHINQDYYMYNSNEGCSSTSQERLVLMNRHTREETILAECGQDPHGESLSEYHAGWVGRPSIGYYTKYVHYHNLETGITRAIDTTGGGYTNFVTTDEDHVVWQDSRSGHREVYMYTISTGIEECLTPDEWEQAWPKLRNGIILWADYSTTQEWGEGGASQVYIYDVHTGVGRQLTHHNDRMWMPRFVDSGWAVYAWSIIGHRSKFHAHDLVADGILTPEGRVIP
jgi:hypothetical protein